MDDVLLITQWTLSFRDWKLSITGGRLKRRVIMVTKFLKECFLMHYQVRDDQNTLPIT